MPSLALANLRLRKARTIISVLAVAVGIMTLLVLRGLTEGTIGEVADRMQSVQADLLVWDKSHNTFMHNYTMSEGWQPLVAQIPGVTRVVPVLNDSISLAGQAQTIYAISPQDFDIFGGERALVAGRLFGADSMEIVIDEVLAREAQLAVDDTVEHRVEGEPFKVAGIVREGVVGRVFMPYDTAARMWQEGKRRASMLMLKVGDPADSDGVARAIKELGLVAIDKGNYYSVIAHDAKYLDYFIWSTTAITLLVSFLTILLTMFTIIQEQTREVGILKSLGATRGFIARVVVAQSLLVCGAGVAVGFLLSLGAKLGLKLAFPLLTVRIDWGLATTAVAVGLVGGLLGALYPAWRAARLDPVETLSYE